MPDVKVSTAPERGGLPEELEKVREVARRAISPLRPADNDAPIGQLFLSAERTKAGRKLPAYYLVYYLLVEFLGFRNLGRWEKVAWSIPIEFEGHFYLIDHRKFGVGVFCDAPDALESQAQKIVALIRKGVKVADPFFRWLAANAVRQSQVNVRNNSAWLFQRYEYLRDQFRKRLTEAKAREHEVEEHTTTNPQGVKVTSYDFPGRLLMQQAHWVGIAAVDAFFSWTEHVFIHLAIIQRRITTGAEVADLIADDWPAKFKQALDLGDKGSKDFYDRLLALRKQIRNYTAHGSFGKQGEAFDFHSRAGAVPVMLGRGRGNFSLMGEAEFDEESAIATIEDFIAHLWSSARQPARLYIQEASLPMILTFTKDGRFEKAMRSMEDMDRFVEDLSGLADKALNMD